MPSKSTATSPIADHEIHLFYQCDGIDPALGPETTLGCLSHAAGTGNSQTESDPVPPDQQIAIAGRYGQIGIWEQVNEDEKRLSPDLHLFIRQLLSGEQPGLVTCWGLGQQAQRFLKSADLYDEETPSESRFSKQLTLSFGATAKKRMADLNIACDRLLLNVTQCRLYVFGTGHAFVDLAISVKRIDDCPVTAIEIEESVATLSRFNECEWLLPEGKIAGNPFSFGRLIRRMVLGSKAELQFHRSRRVKTYTYVQFATVQPPDVTIKFATMLARHYTRDYQLPDNPEPSTQILSPFTNITHVVALEGAAAVVAPLPEAPTLPAFLNAFKTNVFRKAYVAVAMLAMHEEAFLLRRTTSSTHAISGRNEQTLEELRDLRGAALVFRLHYRFSQVSQISMHNALHGAFRVAFGSDWMLSKLTADVEAAESFLREAAIADESAEEHARHRRFYWATIIGGAALAGLTTYTIVKEVAYLAWNEKAVAGWAGVSFGLSVALAAATIAYLRRPRKHAHLHSHEGHLTTHAMVEHMIKAALK